MADVIMSQELYEAAGDAWVAARARVEAARAELQAAEAAMTEAEQALAAQEAYPGIPAYAHAAIPAERCRIGATGYGCRFHAGWQDEGPF